MLKIITCAFLFVIFSVPLYFPQNGYQIKGKVLDEHDDAPLIGVSVLVIESKMGSVTDVEGDFTINHVPAGEYNLRFSYIGHSTVMVKIKVPSDDAVKLKISLPEAAIRYNDIIITGNPFKSEEKNIVQPLVSLSSFDLELVRHNSLGEMLNHQPGVSMVSNGLAVSRPVIRGFGSNRIIILEDGLRMGDLSGSSADHSVSEDGSNPEKIEIIKGPSALLYSSSAAGGIINVMTGLIPSTIPDRLLGTANISGNSVSDQKLGNLDLEYGTGRMSYTAGIFYRKGNDYLTPSKSRIPNSDLESKGFKGGLSFHPKWGMIGASVSGIKNIYGIPFNMNELSGEGPVFIDMNKTEYRLSAEVDSISNLFPQMEIKTGYLDYGHREISRTDNEVGSVFGLRTFTGDVFLRHKLFGFADYLKGGIGVWGLTQRYSVTGEEALTPDADNINLAIYLFEEATLDMINLQGALRFETSRIKMPETTLTDSVFSAQEKTFNSLSSSVGMLIHFNKNLSASLNLSNSFRSPSVEELGSYGFHAAVGTFDIGNRNLEIEKNYGIEAGFILGGERFYLELTGYYNLINDYIFRNPSAMLFDEEAGLNDTSGLPVYNYEQTNAVIYGAELKSTADFGDGFTITLTSDIVRGKYKDFDKNLPLMPPARLSIEPRFTRDYYWFGVAFKGAANQDRVADNETPTAGYGIIDIYGGVKFVTSSLIHQVDLRIDNLLNHEYREHLSALKEFAPSPARNFILSYKLLF